MGDLIHLELCGGGARGAGDDLQVLAPRTGPEPTAALEAVAAVVRAPFSDKTVPDAWPTRALRCIDAKVSLSCQVLDRCRACAQQAQRPWGLANVMTLP